MLEKFTNKFLTNLFSYGFGSLFLGIPFIIYWLLVDYLWVGVAGFGLFLFVVAYGSYKDILETENKAHQAQLNEIQIEAASQVAKVQRNLKVTKHKEQMWRQLLKERTGGFTTLFEEIASYEKLIDDNLSDYLRTKPHPAINASEIVKSETKRRRDAELKQKKTQKIIEYYEIIAPFLSDFKEQEIDDSEEPFRSYNDDEKADPVTHFLTKEEFRKLSVQERNEIALERYWKRPKSKRMLGQMYERYVGSIYEQKGYIVEYAGIFEGYEDLGRDLICSKDNEVIVIQCKYWSQFKTIFEKHIFQFFGTVFQYRDQNRNKKVSAIFYTSTALSELARHFAKELKIDLKENFKMKTDYPCIKCNISQVDGAKIYHLPFDQQYDNVKIELNKGEFYCATVQEAEEKGFRRAYRWHGTKGD